MIEIKRWDGIESRNLPKRNLNSEIVPINFKKEGVAIYQRGI